MLKELKLCDSHFLHGTYYIKNKKGDLFPGLCNFEYNVYKKLVGNKSPSTCKYSEELINYSITIQIRLTKDVEKKGNALWLFERDWNTLKNRINYIENLIKEI